MSGTVPCRVCMLNTASCNITLCNPNVPLGWERYAVCEDCLNRYARMLHGDELRNHMIIAHAREERKERIKMQNDDTMEQNNENTIAQVGMTPQRAFENIDILWKNVNEAIEKVMSEIPDANIVDLMTFNNLLNIQVATVVAKTSRKDGERVNVRTVIEDNHHDTLDILDILADNNPELKDDYVWPELE